MSSSNKKIKCLLVKLNDGRMFFTSRINHQHLLEFSNVCNAELKMVEAVEPSIVTLRELVTRICDQTHQSTPTYYEVLKSSENEVPRKHHYAQYTSFSKLTARQKMLKKVSNIRDFIAAQFKDGAVVRVKDMAKKLQKHGISASTLYRHVNYVIKQLIDDGRNVTKIAPGAYQLAKLQDQT